MVSLGTALSRAFGTGLGTPSRGDKLLYALTGFSASSYFATQAAGGEAGVQNFGIVTMFRVTALGAGATRFFGQKLNSVTPAGWQKFFRTTNEVQASFRATGAYVDTPSVALTASDVGRVHVAIAHLTTTQARMLVDRVERGPGTAITTYVPGNTAQMIGQNGGLTGAATGIDIIETATFRGSPTDTQLQAAFDAIRASGTIPTSLAGMTLTHKWPDRALLKTLTAPATIPDVVTNATADALTKTGAPTVTTIDLTRDGRRTLGAQFGGTSCLETAVGAGIQGVASGFWGIFAGPLYAIQTGSQMIVHCNSGSTGWFCQYNGAVLRFAVYIAGALVEATNYTLTSADLGRDLWVGFHYTGSAVRLYFRGAQVGSDVAAGAFTPAASMPMRFGLWQTSQPLTAAGMFSFVGGQANPSAADFANAWTNYQATSRLAALSGLTKNRYELTEDCLPTESVPATVQDRVGTDHLTRVGTGLTLAQRTERAYSYETSPILTGLSNLGTANYYSSATGFAGTVAPWWGLWLGVIEKNTGITSGVRVIAGRRNATTGEGFGIYTNGTNSSIGFIVSNGSTTSTSPSSIIAAADVGKLVLGAAVFDSSGKARWYWKRVEQGTGGTALTGSYVPANSDLFYWGRRSDGLGADNLTHAGLCFGLGEPTLAQIQATFDLVMAKERIEPMVGFTPSSLYRLPTGATAAPATLTDLAAGADLTLTGVPTPTNQYARAWAW